MEAGRRFGLDPAVMIDAINTSSGRSYSTEYKFPSFVLPGTYDAGFNINLMVKDIACALELAESTGSPSTVTEVIVEQWRQGGRGPAGRHRSHRRSPSGSTRSAAVDCMTIIG